MTKFNLLLVIILFSSLSGNAQKIPSEYLDSLSILINSMSARSGLQSYVDEKGDQYTLTFPLENFKIYTHNRLAVKAVYKKRGDREVLALTENIDLTKATGIIPSTKAEGAEYIKVIFPEGAVKTQLIENGLPVKTISENYLEFFYNPAASPTFRNKMQKALFTAITSLQVEKGITTTEKLRKEEQDWEELNAEAFITKYPSSLWAAQAKIQLEKLRAQQRAEQELAEKKKQAVLNYIEPIEKKHKIKQGLTEAEFRKYNPEAYEAIGTKNPYKVINAIPKGTIIRGYSRKGKKNFGTGPHSIGFKMKNFPATPIVYLPNIWIISIRKRLLKS